LKELSGGSEAESWKEKTRRQRGGRLTTTDEGRALLGQGTVSSSKDIAYGSQKGADRRQNIRKKWERVDWAVTGGGVENHPSRFDDGRRG